MESLTGKDVLPSVQIELAILHSPKVFERGEPLVCQYGKDLGWMIGARRFGLDRQRLPGEWYHMAEVKICHSAISIRDDANSSCLDNRRGLSTGPDPKQSSFQYELREMTRASSVCMALHGLV